MPNDSERRIQTRSSDLQLPARALVALWLASAAGACVAAEPAAGAGDGSSSAVTRHELGADESTIDGDVEIRTQAEADALGCATVIHGSLSVRPDEPVVTLPNLVEVTGDVRIEVEDTMPDDFQPAEVAALPMLQHVGGSLRFHHFNGHYGSDVQIDLPMLTSLSGNLSLTLSSFNTQVDGLPALASVGGNLDIEAEGDCYIGGLLEALVSIDGDLRIHAHGAGSSGDILRGLKRVGGDVQLESLGGQYPDVLNHLESVGGFLRLRNTYWIEDHFPALLSVGGPFVVEGNRMSSTDAAQVGASNLSIGALALKQTPLKTLPLAASARVSSNGSITIEDNTQLCQSSVDAFIAAQEAAGWAGVLSVAGNDGSCSP